MTEGDLFYILWLLGGLCLPFWPIPALTFLGLLIVSTFIEV